MKQMRNLLTGIFLMLGMLLTTLPVVAQGIEAELDSVAKRDDVTSTEQKENTVDVKEIVFGHIGDAYEWHITTWGKTHVTIPLPIIVYSSQTGWHAFLSSRCVGPKYRKFAPYLLTAFFFIFINNIMGLIPIFPGGANVTGNIAITMVLALFTFVAVNLFGTKTYWKDIFWPDVPWWLKVPVPMMPFIEFFGIFTKPFALMIRLFANMLAGHMAMLVLTCLIFISASMGPALNGTLTVASVLFNIFMNALELLVAFIQAYVFTMLSAVFIGLAQEEHKEVKVKENNN